MKVRFQEREFRFVFGFSDVLKTNFHPPCEAIVSHFFVPWSSHHGARREKGLFINGIFWKTALNTKQALRRAAASSLNWFLDEEEGETTEHSLIIFSVVKSKGTKSQTVLMNNWLVRSYGLSDFQSQLQLHISTRLVLHWLDSTRFCHLMSSGEVYL